MKVHDRDTLDRATATYAPEQLGRTQYLTPEGYLCCEGVRLARTGPMLYAQSEMPEVEPGPGGQMITVLRDADVLFAPETILSFNGKPVTNEHPAQMVSPQTYGAVAVGHVLNARRGEGIEADYLIGDLIITDAETMEAVRAKKKREVSCGYDAEVEQISPGLGRQTKVEGNHVALVKRGRAGPSCAITDEGPAMATKPKRTVFDRLRTAFKAKDEAAFEEELTNAEEAMDDEGDEPQTVVIKIEATPAAAPDADPAAEPVVDDADPNEERFAKIEAAVAQIAEAVGKLTKTEEPPAAGVTDEDVAEEEEEKKEAEKTAVSDTLAKVEVLMPGFKLPKFDSASVATNARLTAARREALTAAMADGARKASVEAVLAGRDLAKMRPSSVAIVFDAAAALAKASNNSVYRPRPADIPQGPMTAARYQERIAERRKTGPR